MAMVSVGGCGGAIVGVVRRGAQSGRTLSDAIALSFEPEVSGGIDRQQRFSVMAQPLQQFDCTFEPRQRVVLGLNSPRRFGIPDVSAAD